MPKNQDRFVIIYDEELIILSQLKSASKSVFIGLLSFVNSSDTKINQEGIRTRKCFPTHEALKKKIHLKQSSISRGVDELKHLMWTFKDKTIPLMTVKKRMNRSNIYTFQYPTFQHMENTSFHHMEKPKLSTGEKNDFPTGEKSKLPTHDKTGTKKGTEKKEHRIYNREKEHALIPSLKKYKEECLKIFPLFDWPIDDIDKNINVWAHNSNFINELYHIAAFNIEKGENHWKNDYFIQGITKWLSSPVESTLSKKREQYIIEVHNRLNIESKEEEEVLYSSDDIRLLNDDLAKKIKIYKEHPSFNASMDLMLFLDCKFKKEVLNQELIKEAQSLIGE